MKILFVNKFLYLVGGSESYMLSLGRHYASEGHDVQYFGMEDGRNVVGNRYGIYAKSIDFRGGTGLQKLLYPFRVVYSVSARRRMGKLLAAFRPDIVHLQNVNYHLTPSILGPIRRAGIPMVQTVHDSQIACPNHRLFVERTAQPCLACIRGRYFHCVRKRCIAHSFPRSLLGYLEARLYHGLGVYGWVDRYILPSLFMRGILAANGIPQEKMTVLRNFSRLEIPRTPPGGKEENGRYALYFGRLETGKGLHTMMEACRRLPEVSFVFAGAGPLEEPLRALPNARCVGFQSGDDLIRWVRNAAFTVCPSDGYENCPLSVVESQALGTPVIGSDIGGIPELIRPGETGLLFESGNADALCDAVRGLYDHPEVTDRMSEACLRSDHLVGFSRYARALLSVYEEVIRGSGRPERP